MPYSSISELPPSVRSHLPLHAQEIFLGAFNAAWDGAPGSEPGERESRAFRIAWAAVKRGFVKRGTEWVPKDAAARRAGF